MDSGVFFRGISWCQFLFDVVSRVVSVGGIEFQHFDYLGNIAFYTFGRYYLRLVYMNGNLTYLYDIFVYFDF